MREPCNVQAIHQQIGTPRRGGAAAPAATWKEESGEEVDNTRSSQPAVSKRQVCEG